MEEGRSALAAAGPIFGQRPVAGWGFYMLRRLMKAVAPIRAMVWSRPSLGDHARATSRWLAYAPGLLGAFCRCLGGPLQRRPSGAAVKDVFPMPWSVQHGGPPGAAGDCSDVVAWTNLCTGLLNYMYGERKADLFFSRPPRRRLACNALFGSTHGTSLTRAEMST